MKTNSKRGSFPIRQQSQRQVESPSFLINLEVLGLDPQTEVRVRPRASITFHLAPTRMMAQSRLSEVPVIRIEVRGTMEGYLQGTAWLWGRSRTDVGTANQVKQGNYSVINIMLWTRQCRLMKMLDEHTDPDLALNVWHNVFQADDCDAFDSDVDEAPTVQTMFMANLSSTDHVYDEASPSYDSDILLTLGTRSGTISGCCLVTIMKVHEMHYKCITKTTLLTSN
ncbi:hypothetical protein Tco_0045543 [Tanacetum coccineum]